MTLYHGSYMAVRQPKVLTGKYTKDFGNGFYCTNMKSQAERWAGKYDTPVVSTYDCVLKAGLRILEFQEMTDEWLDFIVSCRSGKTHDYDIVIGSMANDQIYNYVADFINGVLTREQFWVMAKFKKPTHQMAFCTERALACLKFLKEERL